MHFLQNTVLSQQGVFVAGVTGSFGENGARVGDRLVAVNGQSVRGATVDR